MLEGAYVDYRGRERVQVNLVQMLLVVRYDVEEGSY